MSELYSGRNVALGPSKAIKEPVSVRLGHSPGMGRRLQGLSVE